MTTNTIAKKTLNLLEEDALFTVFIIKNRHGKVSATVVRDSLENDSAIRIASEASTWDEALTLASKLERLGYGQATSGLMKFLSIEAPSMEEAAAEASRAIRGKATIVYHDSKEWKLAILNRSDKDHKTTYHQMLSLTDFYNKAPSLHAWVERATIESLNSSEIPSIAYGTLGTALSQMLDYKNIPFGECEKRKAVRTVVDEFNIAMMHKGQKADLFRLYIWDETSHLFIAADTEEPNMTIEDMRNIPSLALVKEEGLPTVALTFYKGRDHNTESEGRTLTYFANGDQAWEIGLSKEMVDEAFYSLVGLSFLQSTLRNTHQGTIQTA